PSLCKRGEGHVTDNRLLRRLLAAVYLCLAPVARLVQGGDAGVGEGVAVLVHAVAPGFALESPLPAELLVVLHAMLLNVLARRALRRADESENRYEADSETDTTRHHHETPPLQIHDWCL